MAVVAKKNRSMEVSHGREEERKKTGARASGLRCFVRALILAVILFIQMPVNCVKVRVNWGGGCRKKQTADIA